MNKKPTGLHWRKSGFEEPETYRRNCGPVLDYAGCDGGMTFSYYRLGWNDFNIMPLYRNLSFVYPTPDGVLVSKSGSTRSSASLSTRNAAARTSSCNGSRSSLIAVTM
ncbi:MAG: hypothetical protein QG656_990 [Candidatus Hydrogenedentes bacterium]|nr:hypothetical protein [Candidatus Hydrogenedentota bacterium]